MYLWVEYGQDAQRDAVKVLSNLRFHVLDMLIKLCKDVK